LELITILTAKHQDKQSVKRILQYCGPEKYEAYDKPLAAMSNEKAVQMVFKWIGCNSTPGQSYDLRMRVIEREATYGIKMVNRSRPVYVMRLWEVSKVNEKALHYWLPDVNYRNLTTDEINRSALRDKAIGEAVRAMQYAMMIWKKFE